MYREGDLVKVTHLDNDIKEVLSDALEVDFEKIEFYFVEHEDDDYVVLSAETEKKFAIVHCPAEAVEGMSTGEQEVNDLINYLLIDHALKHGNKEMFLELTSPKEKKEKRSQNLFVDVLYDDLDEFYVEEYDYDEEHDFDYIDEDDDEFFS